MTDTTDQKPIPLPDQSDDPSVSPVDAYARHDAEWQPCRVAERRPSAGA